MTKTLTELAQAAEDELGVLRTELAFERVANRQAQAQLAERTNELAERTNELAALKQSAPGLLRARLVTELGAPANAKDAALLETVVSLRTRLAEHERGHGAWEMRLQRDQLRARVDDLADAMGASPGEDLVAMATDLAALGAERVRRAVEAVRQAQEELDQVRQALGAEVDDDVVAVARQAARTARLGAELRRELGVTMMPEQAKAHLAVTSSGRLLAVTPSGLAWPVGDVTRCETRTAPRLYPWTRGDYAAASASTTAQADCVAVVSMLGDQPAHWKLRITDV